MTIRAVFVCTAAALAAALGDALVEGISNAGVFWRGHYTDQSSLDLVPTFGLAALGALVTLALCVWRSFRPGVDAAMRSLLLSSSRLLSADAIGRLLPVIFALQIAVLFGMESIEQYVVYGHTFGGTLWLGAPVAASLALHGLLSVVCASAMAGVLRVSASAVTRIVTHLIERFIFIAREPVAIAVLRERRLRRRTRVTLATRIGRGPPDLGFSV